MISEKQKFIKVWWVCFKYLFFVMALVLVFRTALLFYHDQADSVTFWSVLLGFTIAFLGIAFVCGIIAGYAIVQDRKHNQ
ncbi:hypothetical protein [Neptunicella sp.]|uniref:hypothetical protein n=1 Tax=Neptunicella sp. TaxID=2125986 RepID=UPI003F68DDDB